MLLRATIALSLSALMSTPIAAQCTYSTPLGSGCGYSSPFGIPTIACNGSPTIGHLAFGLTASATCVGTPVTGALIVGPCLPTPIQFTDGPATGLCIAEAVCALHLNPCFVLLGTPGVGGFTYQIPVPADPLLIGLQLCAQSAHTCSGLTCLMATNVARVTVM